MHDRIIAWICRKVHDAGKPGVVVGISGGIDSALVACLAREALGEENVKGFWLPSISGEEFPDEIHDLVDACNIALEEVDIAPMLVEAESAIQPVLVSLYKLMGNVAARLRMTVLYALAEDLDYLVIGTTNKSEAMIGYYTKWGDGAVDLEPIADLYKHEVYEMARKYYSDMIPEAIFNKAPSAGLWEGQTDEDELGFKYEDLLHPPTERIQRLIEETEHKRHMPPTPGV